MIATNLAEGVQRMTSNAYFVDGDTPTLIDVGAGFDIIERIEQVSQGSIPAQVILTHTHPDHVGNVDTVRDAFDIDVYGIDAQSRFVDTPLEHGEHVQVGDSTYEVWFTPGHAPDHLCLYSSTERVLFSGDLIFPHGGVGRTDLPGCDHRDLVESIKFVVEHVDDDLRVLFAGHGPIIEQSAYDHILAAARLVEHT